MCINLNIWFSHSNFLLSKWFIIHYLFYNFACHLNYPALTSFSSADERAVLLVLGDPWEALCCVSYYVRYDDIQGNIARLPRPGITSLIIYSHKQSTNTGRGQRDRTREYIISMLLGPEIMLPDKQYLRANKLSGWLANFNFQPQTRGWVVEAARSCGCPVSGLVCTGPRVML